MKNELSGFPREVTPPPDTKSTMWCQECGRGDWSAAIQYKPNGGIHGLTMIGVRGDYVCELCHPNPPSLQKLNDERAEV